MSSYRTRRYQHPSRYCNRSRHCQVPVTHQQSESIATRVVTDSPCWSLILDVFLTRTDCIVKTLDVEPPVLSDHSFITVSVDLQFSHGSLVNTVRRRNWRQFSYADFCYDLNQSALLHSPPTDAAGLFTCYHETLLELVDKHAPFADTRIHAHPNAPWYDGRCRAVKMKTRKLERAYRRDKSENSYQVWRQQSTFMRHYFQQRYTVYWRSSISDNMNDPKALWSKISALLDAPQAPSLATTHTADAFANHFHFSVEGERYSQLDIQCTISKDRPSAERNTADVKRSHHR